MSQSDGKMNDLIVALETVRRAGYRVTEPPPPPPEHHCMVCGKTDEQNEADFGGDLIDVTVTIAEGEEGYARAEKYVCGFDLDKITEWLVAGGFGVHEHGGTCFLEPEDCPGFGDMDACSTPEPED